MKFTLEKEEENITGVVFFSVFFITRVGSGIFFTYCVVLPMTGLWMFSLCQDTSFQPIQI